MEAALLWLICRTSWLSLCMKWVAFLLALVQTLCFSPFVSEKNHIFCSSMIRLTLHCLSQVVNLQKFQFDLRQLLATRKLKKGLFSVRALCVCVRGEARGEVFAISAYIKLEASLNICLEFWVLMLPVFFFHLCKVAGKWWCLNVVLVTVLISFRFNPKVHSIFIWLF